MALSKAWPSMRISTPGGSADKVPCPHTGQRCPTASSSWRHSVRSAPPYASAPRRPVPGRGPPWGWGDASPSNSPPPASPPPASKPAAASATGATSPPPAPSPSASLDVDDASGAGGVWALRPRPKNPSRSRCTLRWVSWRANAIQQYIRITHSTPPASSAPKLLWCTRAMSASPASALSVTLSAGFFTIASLLSPSLTPMAAPGGLGQLTCALGFWRGQKLLRDRRRLHIRVGFGPELIGHLEGDPNQVG